MVEYFLFKTRLSSATMKKNKLIRLLTVAAVAVLLVWLGWNKWFGNNESSGALKSVLETPVIRPVTVKAQVMRAGYFNENLVLSGTLVAADEVQLVTETSGRIVYLNLQEGQRVAAGALLVRLNQDDLLAQLAKHEAVLNELKRREIRQSALLEKEAISQQEYDLLTAELASVQADVALVKAQMEKTEIRAPFSGKVGLRYVSQGAYVGNNTRIAELVNAKPLFIDFAVPEKHASSVTKGMMLHFTVENLADTFIAEVVALAPRIESSTRTLQVRARASNSSESLIPGSFARVRLSLNQITDALLLKNTAIVPDMAGKKVFVVRNGVATAVQIVTGERSAEAVLVKQGLQVGDTVITSGVLKVRPGTPVEIVEVQ
jgi:membrane fusion protein (multidrug efflux system)